MLGGTYQWNHLGLIRHLRKGESSLMKQTAGITESTIPVYLTVLHF